MITSLVFALGVVVIANLIIFVLAYRLQTDKLTDITYSLSFLFIALFGFVYGKGWESLPKLLLTLLVAIWAVRLGSFLLGRIKKMGHDKRFEKIRVNWGRFMRFFIMQGVGSWVIGLPLLLFVLRPTEANSDAFTPIYILGFIIAVIGLVMEVVADNQKSKFKAVPGNHDKLYTGGLYKYVRYPNYSGEILFWSGIFIATIDTLSGWAWLSLFGPISIILLLLFVSGIPYLERGRAKQYGSQDTYKRYIDSTKKIIPGIY